MELLLQRYWFPRNGTGRNNPTIWLKRWTIKSSGMPTEGSIIEDVSKPCMRHNDTGRFKPTVESDGPLTLADQRER
jgi:hypothetical protein